MALKPDNRPKFIGAYRASPYRAAQNPPSAKEWAMFVAVLFGVVASALLSLIALAGLVWMLLTIVRQIRDLT